MGEKINFGKNLTDFAKPLFGLMSFLQPQFAALEQNHFRKGLSFPRAFCLRRSWIPARFLKFCVLGGGGEWLRSGATYVVEVAPFFPRVGREGTPTHSAIHSQRRRRLHYAEKSFLPPSPRKVAKTAGGVEADDDASCFRVPLSQIEILEKREASIWLLR